MNKNLLAEWRSLLIVILPAAVILFLFGYCYLGFVRGGALFRFLLGTTLGNAILWFAVAFYAYHVTKNFIPSVPKDEPDSKASVLEHLHVVLFLVFMSAVFYPVFRSLLGASQGYFDVTPALLSLAASALILPPYLREGGRLLALSYLIIGVVAAAALGLTNEVREAFAELAKLVTYIETLIRELGVA